MTLYEFIIENVFHNKTERKLQIIMYRQKDVFGFGKNEKTFKEIGDFFGISGTRVRQICDKAKREVSCRCNTINEKIKQPHVILKEVEKLPENGNLPARILLIENLGDMSVRTWNCLHCANIKTIEDLLARKRSDLLRTPNFGRKSLKELESLLEQNGIKWG
jgi:hypothetical protein